MDSKIQNHNYDCDINLNVQSKDTVKANSMFSIVIDEIIKNEGGFSGQITEYLLGYWLWTTSIFLMSITLMLNELLINKKTTGNN